MAFYIDCCNRFAIRLYLFYWFVSLNGIKLVFFSAVEAAKHVITCNITS